MNFAKKFLKAVMVSKVSKTDCVPARIQPGLLLGGIGCVALQASLEAAGVTHVLCVADAILPLYVCRCGRVMACGGGGCLQGGHV